MAVVQGIKEKVHLPIYDSIKVEPEKQLRDVESSSTLKFFSNVQGKTKLETNLQSASLLPHYNTFEARAMRVVIRDLPPEVPDDVKVTSEGMGVTGEDAADANKVKDLTLSLKTNAGVVAFTAAAAAGPFTITADVELGLDQVRELLRKARENPDGVATVDLDDESVTLLAGDDFELVDAQIDKAADLADPLEFTVDDLEKLIEDVEEEKKKPPKVQYMPNNGAGSIVSKFIYNTVTTFFVGEKEMIKMPTWFFPAGAGPYSEAGKFSTHGEPNPTATFRFAEPIFIDKQQNFRVEIEIPDSDTLKELQRIYGPLFIWVVLDGYMTRDVQ
jgi:hypothetical protein